MPNFIKEHSNIQMMILNASELQKHMVKQDNNQYLNQLNGIKNI